jgi:hypothetical protein
VKGQITLAAFSEIWLPKHDVSHNVRLSYASALKLHITAVLGATPMTNIGTPEIAALLREIDKLERPATTPRVKAVLSPMFQAAAEDKTSGVRVTATGPVKSVKLVRRSTDRMTW